MDATDALADHLRAIVLVGAQAIYLHTGEGDLSAAPYTTDADFAADPTDLAGHPLIADLLEAGGFTPREHPGSWLSPNGISIDLMVPDALAGPGTRGARLGSHGKRVARRAKGLEGALVDRAAKTIGALDPTDTRTVTMQVAGPGALLVAKVHKVAERTRANDRVRNKDALDVLRLLRAIQTSELSDGLHRLRHDPLSASVTDEAIEGLGSLFGQVGSVGTQMAVDAAGPQEDPRTIAASMAELVSDLLAEL